MLENILPALKFYVGLVGTILTAASGSFGPDSTVGRIITFALALVTAIGVYLATNVPKGVVSFGAEDHSDAAGA